MLLNLFWFFFKSSIFLHFPQPWAEGRSRSASRRKTIVTVVPANWLWRLKYVHAFRHLSHISQSILWELTYFLTTWLHRNKATESKRQIKQQSQTGTALVGSGTQVLACPLWRDSLAHPTGLIGDNDFKPQFWSSASWGEATTSHKSQVTEFSVS